MPGWNGHVGKHDGRCRQFKRVTLSTACGSNAHLAFRFERPEGQIEIVELNRVSLDGKLRRDRRGLLIKRSLGQYRIRPACRTQCIDRSEIPCQGEREVVDLAAEVGLNRR